MEYTPERNLFGNRQYHALFRKRLAPSFRSLRLASVSRGRLIAIPTRTASRKSSGRIHAHYIGMPMWHGENQIDLVA
jgi:hypothetical protein